MRVLVVTTGFSKNTEEFTWYTTRVVLEIRACWVCRNVRWGSSGKEIVNDVSVSGIFLE